MDYVISSLITVALGYFAIATFIMAQNKDK